MDTDEVVVLYIPIPKDIRGLIPINLYLAQYLLLQGRHFKRLIVEKINISR